MEDTMLMVASSSETNTGDVVIVPPPGCTTPISPTDEATGVAIGGSLTWNSVARATGYKLWFGTGGGGSTDPTNIVNGTDLGDVTTYGYAGLAEHTIHYWKVVPYNAGGDAAGCDIWKFTTGAVPAVTTASVTNITATGADCGGNVTDAGSSPVTARGVCWNTAGSFTTADSHTTDGSGLGSFTSSITGLTSGGHTYYVRAYATNSEGTGYGEQKVFATPMTPPGNALDFDGDNDYVNVGHDASFNVTVAQSEARCFMEAQI